MEEDDDTPHAIPKWVQLEYKVCYEHICVYQAMRRQLIHLL